MMRYKTKDIGDEGLDLDLPVTPQWLAAAIGDAGAELAPEGLSLVARLEPSGDDFLLRGRLRGAVSMPCGRCLEPTRVPIDVPVTVSFVEKLPERAEGGHVEVETDDGDFVVFEDGVIDLEHELREEILLALPMAPRCEPECAGICPICGKNRAHNACDCADRERAALSPFAALQKLKS
jgi:uncharacterized protein